MTEKARLAVVTGGTGGIGTAICRRLARDGYSVVAVYHPADEENARAWQADLQKEGVEIHIAAGDVSKAPESNDMIEEIEQRFGPIGVLVNCAGITRDKTFKRMEQEHWESVINS